MLPALAYLEQDNNEFNKTNLEDTSASGSPKRSLFRAYTNAADKGLASGQEVCAQDFGSKCPYSVEKRLNMPVLQFWNLLSSLLKFNIQDDVHSF